MLTKDGKTLVQGMNGDVTIPDGVTSIGDSAFFDCVGLTGVTIPGSVTNILEYAFYDCVGLTGVTIPDSVTSIGYGAFAYCSGLTNVVIRSGVTSIGEYAFGACEGLTSVTIPDSVTSIGGYAFEDCLGLTNAVIGSGVTTIGDGAFEFCIGLTSVTIPDSVMSIGWYAFGCEGLTSVIFRGNAPDIVDEDAFSGVREDCTVYVRKDSTGWGVDIPGTWNGLNIQYMTTEVEIAVANEAGGGMVEVEGEFSAMEVSSGVTLIVKGDNLDATALAANITPKPHEGGQSVALFKVKAESVAGGVSLTVLLDEEAVAPDETAVEIVGSETMAAFSAAAEGATVAVPLTSAKPGLYYGIAAVSDLAQMGTATANAPLVRADDSGVAIHVAKPAGSSAFFKVIVSDRAR